MIYTIERVHSCVGEARQAVFRLSYEVSFIAERALWRYFLIYEEEIEAIKQEHTPVLVATSDAIITPAPLVAA